MKATQTRFFKKKPHRRNELMCGIFVITFKAGAISPGRRAILGNNLVALTTSAAAILAFVVSRKTYEYPKGLGDMGRSCLML